MQIMVMVLVMAVSCVNAMDEEIKRSSSVKDEQLVDAQTQAEKAKLEHLMKFQWGAHKGKFPTRIELMAEDDSGVGSWLYYMTLISNDGYWEETTACLANKPDKREDVVVRSFRKGSEVARSPLDNSEQANFNVSTIAQLCKLQEKGKKLDTVEACLKSIARTDSSKLVNLGNWLYSKCCCKRNKINVPSKDH